MAPAPRGRLSAVAKHNISILTVLMFLRFRQRNRRTRVRREYARQFLRNRHVLGGFHQLTPKKDFMITIPTSSPIEWTNTPWTASHGWKKENWSITIHICALYGGPVGIFVNLLSMRLMKSLTDHRLFNSQSKTEISTPAISLRVRHFFNSQNSSRDAIFHRRSRKKSWKFDRSRLRLEYTPVFESRPHFSRDISRRW